MIHALVGEELEEVVKKARRFELFISKRGFLTFLEDGEFKIPIVGYKKGKGTIIKVDPIYKGDSVHAKRCMKRFLEEAGLKPLKSNL